MSSQKTTLSRTELYEKVWTTPMQVLAKEFGISDVGLAKLCRRHNIPLPGRGYWARIQFGQKLDRPPLPVSKEPRLDTIEIWRSEPRPAEQFKPKDERPIPKVEIKDDRQITHPVVARFEKSLSRSKKDERGLITTKQGRAVPFKVSADALPRTLRILDALLSALSNDKYKLEWPKPYNTQLTIISEDEKMRLFITETVERSEHKATKEEVARQKQDYWRRPPMWDYRPTGRLKFTLESVEFSLRSSWSDGKRRKLEDCLGEILVELERTAPAVKKAREAQAERERKWAEARKREQEAAIRRAEYERKANAIKKLSQDWQESKLIRDFAAALQAAIQSVALPDDAKKELQAMVDWTADHAEYVDPLTDLNWAIREFKSAWF